MPGPSKVFRTYNASATLDYCLWSTTAAQKLPAVPDWALEGERVTDRDNYFTIKTKFYNESNFEVFGWICLEALRSDNCV